MTEKLKCPVCGDYGVLMKKITITKTTKRQYRYKKWYVYHNRSKGTRQRWCYLSKKYLRLPEINEAILRVQATQSTTQTTQKTDKPKIASKSEMMKPRWLSSVERQPRKLLVAGSKPARGSISN